MGKGLKRSNSEYRPPNDDEPDFGDPPRHWGRVASMAGVWAVVLLGAAWMAPGFASGGNSDDDENRFATSPDEAAWAYLDESLKGDEGDLTALRCLDDSPEVDSDFLEDRKAYWTEQLDGLTRITPRSGETDKEGEEFRVTVDLVFGSSADGSGRNEGTDNFLATVRSFEDSDGAYYCVAEMLHTGSDGEPVDENSTADPDDTEPADPQTTAARYLSAALYDGDHELASEFQCDRNFSGASELIATLMDWEEANSVEVEGVDQKTSEAENINDTYIVPVSVDFLGTSLAVNFEVGVTEDGCVESVTSDDAPFESIGTQNLSERSTDTLHECDRVHGSCGSTITVQVHLVVQVRT